MPIKTSQSSPSLSASNRPNQSAILAFTIASSVLFSGLLATSTAAQAAGLGDLFGDSQNDAKSKFLPVEQAFQVSSSSAATASGTRLSVNFDITPEHYVYKNQIKLTLPDGVTAAPFTFSQTPYAIDDPTFGKVQVFDQANMVATTTLTSNKGKRLNDAAIVIGWQGCAKAGLCYPPEKIKTTVNIAPASTQIGARETDEAALDASLDDAATADTRAATTNIETTSVAADTNNAEA